MYALKKLMASVESENTEMEPAAQDYEALMTDATQPHPMQQELDAYVSEFGESEER